MRKNPVLKTSALLLLLAVCCLSFALSAHAETMTFNNVGAALRYIKKNQPSELTLEKLKLSPSKVLQIRDAMPEGSVFHFSTTWKKAVITDESTEVDLTGGKGTITKDDLEAIVTLCPNLTKIDNSKNRSPSNNVMIPLIEKYPNVQFEWVVSLGKGHFCSTMATTFTTMLPPSSGRELTSEKLELLKYCPRLKALDLGHNKVTTLDFLQYVPDLELLIIGQNQVTDITPVGQLKHLQYAELFTNPFTDISALANCTELLDLNITNCQVLDFSPLDEIQTLERFWANMIKKLTEEETQRFIEKHPNTEVDFMPSHAATVDGWRKHPRYRHYIWCFKNKTWIPFDEPLPT